MGLFAKVVACVALVALPGLAASLDAGKSSPEALRKLGFKYYHGEGVAQDNARATKK